MKRIDVSLRLGNAPAPWGLPEFGVADEYLTYAAKPKENAGFEMKRADERGHGVIAEDRAVFLAEILSGKKARPDISKADHILRARQYSRRAVLCRGGKSLRAGEGEGARAGDSHRVVTARYSRLKAKSRVRAQWLVVEASTKHEHDSRGICMPLFLNNDDVEKVITMKDTMESLEILYRELGEGIAVGAPRSDLHVPTAAAKNAEAPMAHYLKSMSGASPHFGTAALRFSSDIVTWRPAGDGIRREKLPTMPGNRWLGIVLLFSSANGELLAIMNDGVLQRMRVGGANGVATKYLARQDAETVGLIGSGWQAGSQVMAVCEARTHQENQSIQPDARESGKVRP